MELKLYKLVMENDYVECYKWQDDMFLIWVWPLWWDNFIEELTEIFGNSIFDEGGFDARIQQDFICIDLVEALGSHVDIQEVFTRETDKNY